MPTTVRSAKGLTYAQVLADPGLVYVGRAVPRRGFPGTPYENPRGGSYAAA